jgi:tRNA pseudouridine38-40 synthase
MRYKCIVAYDGTNFHGFQVQGDLRTVQSEIEAVLLIITKTKTRIHASGRTDTGVHAYGQVFHFDTDIAMLPENMQNAINSRLPKDIYVKTVENVSNEFHSRFSAKSKVYQYLIDLGEYNPLLINYRYYYHYPINLEQMKIASEYLVGEHDFKSFTKNHHLTNSTRTIYSLEIINDDNLIIITFHGDGFMHNMVRIIVAMLLEVARGKITTLDFKQILESKDRKKAPKLAPPNGLYLERVIY